MTSRGKIDYKNLWRDHQERTKRVRWRTLRLQPCVAAPLYREALDSISRLPDGTLLVHIFGYNSHADGPWFGYTKAMLKDAPCCHCGQTNIFHQLTWTHICPGWYDGVRLPCQDDHACKGEPSMSAGAPMWRSEDWIEVSLGTTGLRP